jgi:ABC-2 type transport system ATP-binding protein
MSTPFIEVSQISKAYNGQRVLADMNFTINSGEIVGLLGPNGAGKTTMVRLLNGVIMPDQGTVRVGGLNPFEEAQGTKVRQMSGILTEGAGMYHDLSGIENLRFFAKLYGVQNAEQRIKHLLDQFDLTAHKDKAVGTYSTGMKKRVGLAKALLHQPKMLFLDEPTNGLDPEGIQMVMDYIQKLNRETGTTILLCSHVLHQIESVCHRYLFLQNGRVVEQGTKQEIESKYMHETQLQMETGLVVHGDTYGGYPVKRVAPDQLLFILPNKDAISDLLRAILQESWVHAAEIVNRDLETLYFQVRKEQSVS